MTLSAHSNVDRLVDQEIREFPIAASANIFRSALVGADPSGHLKPFVPGDEFVGLAYEGKDNSSGADGDLKARVFVQGDFNMALAGVVVADRGKAVYATADDALHLNGHPDGYVGRIIHHESANMAVVRLKSPGEQPMESDTGSIELVEEFKGPITVTGAAGAGALIRTRNFLYTSALGLGVRNVAGPNGAIDMAFDAVAEIAHAGIETPALFDVLKGITLEARIHLTDIGDDAALDANWGIGTLLNANSRASIDHTDMVNLAAFSLDGNVANILAQSDNGVLDVAAVDTTIDNDTAAGAFKDTKIIIRPTGIVEFWIDAVRMLPNTVFAVATTVDLAAFVQMEKTSNDTLAVLLLERIRVAGGRS